MKKINTEILIVGAGASGVCAAIQAARMGRKVALVEESPWLGGMLTAAGVSAIDGNHKLPSGLWGEFRSRLYDHYGGPQAVETGWVSNTLFEPRVGERILRDMALSAGDVHLFHGFFPVEVLMEKDRIMGVRFSNDQKQEMEIRSLYTIDATEYGDVIALSGAEYRYGRESAAETGEAGAPEKADRFIQDLTYVAVLKDYGPDADRTIARPQDYDPHEFKGCCREWDDELQKNTIDAQKMLEYGRLPGDKFMINWPRNGNDFFSHLAVMDRAGRLAEIEKSKAVTLRFVYFIQHQLGFKNLGLADDEFPTSDRLALIPYIREGRRIVGKTTLNLQHILHPYSAEGAGLYQQGIAVGNYPLDHHHDKAGIAVDEKYAPIPAFNVPFACLIPQKVRGLIAAEKSISVTHMVNGCTRLQPVVMQIGQAAGAAAALAVEKDQPVEKLNVRELQETLLQAGMWLMPFTDVTPEHWAFKSLQRMALCGLLKGQGKASDWANEFYIFPEKPVTAREAVEALSALNPEFKVNNELHFPENLEHSLTRQEGVRLIWQALGSPKESVNLFLNDVQDLAVDFILAQNLGTPWIDFEKELFYPKEPMTRSVFAHLIDHLFRPFKKPLFFE
ncbi:FAD-dependent oxidoreductase [Calditrichota bacterium LG25]